MQVSLLFEFHIYIKNSEALISIITPENLHLLEGQEGPFLPWVAFSLKLGPSL